MVGKKTTHHLQHHQSKLLIIGFAVALPHYSHLPLRQSTVQSIFLKQPAKRPVGRPSSELYNYGLVFYLFFCTVSIAIYTGMGI